MERASMALKHFVGLRTVTKLISRRRLKGKIEREISVDEFVTHRHTGTHTLDGSDSEQF